MAVEEEKPVFTCTHVLFGWSPVLYVSRREGAQKLQFLCSGHPHDDNDYRLTQLAWLLMRDQSLAGQAALPAGVVAWRDARGGTWQKKGTGPTI